MDTASILPKPYCSPRWNRYGIRACKSGTNFRGHSRGVRRCYIKMVSKGIVGTSARVARSHATNTPPFNVTPGIKVAENISRILKHVRENREHVPSFRRTKHVQSAIKHWPKLRVITQRNPTCAVAGRDIQHPLFR